MTEFYLRCGLSAIFGLSGGLKASGAMNGELAKFGFPYFFAQALGLAEVALAAVNVGAELAPIAGIGAQAAPAAAANVWVQRAASLIMGGAICQHFTAGDGPGGFVAPVLLLAISGAVPALRGDASSPVEAAGIAAAIAGAGFAICSLMSKKPAGKEKK